MAVRKLFIGVLVCSLLLFCSNLFSDCNITENDWQVAFNSKVTKGRLEVVTSAGRIDILTSEYAIEVDKVIKYEEGVEQSLRYAAATGKNPGLALYIDGQEGGYSLFEKAKEVCKNRGIKLWLINDYVSIEDINSLETKPRADLGEKANEKAYWLNTQSNIRHNRSCRYFRNTKKGRLCSKNEGRPCKKCGG